MIIMKGKYNVAKIMIDNIDDSTREQIQGFLNHPAFGKSDIVVMPDCHAGKGAVVGFTMKRNDYIIPNVIGVDISCGMTSECFGKIGDKLDLKALDNYIKDTIPAGFHIHEKEKQVSAVAYHRINETCERVGTDFSKVLRAVGTLGGGNHFLEVGIDTFDRIWVTVHTGSRNFGLKVANYYQTTAKRQLEKYFIKDYKDLEFLHKDDPMYSGYLCDVESASLFADENRREIMRRIREFLGILTPEDSITSVHNYIGVDGIIRKGATSAHDGEYAIIPFNMRDGIALCRGKGNVKYNFSAPHGAGRILSRKKAKEMLNTETFQKQMADAGVYTTTATAETLDESPDAYKDMNTILECIRDTVTIETMIRPLYNFKAGGE